MGPLPNSTEMHSPQPVNGVPAVVGQRLGLRFREGPRTYAVKETPEEWEKLRALSAEQVYELVGGVWMERDYNHRFDWI